MDERENEEKIFIELAKVKKQLLPIRTDAKTPEVNDEEGKLMVDVYQKSNEIVVQTTLAGAKEEDLDIHITSDSVTIRGTREKLEKIEDKDYFYQECFWGAFSRSVILPEKVDPDISEAVFKNGILTIYMPKLSQKKIKKLKIKTQEENESP